MIKTIKKRNPIAKTLPEFRHKRFKDKTKYDRKKLKELTQVFYQQLWVLQIH